MGKECRDYRIIKEVYAFLNQQMKCFEETAELQPAIDHLLESIGNYFCANTVQLYKKEEGRYIPVSIWPVHDEEADNWTRKLIRQIDIGEGQDGYTLSEEGKNKLLMLPLLDKDKIIAVLAIVKPDEEKLDGLLEIADMLGNWLSNRLVKRD